MEPQNEEEKGLVSLVDESKPCISVEEKGSGLIYRMYNDGYTGIQLGNLGNTDESTENDTIANTIHQCIINETNIGMLCTEKEPDEKNEDMCNEVRNILTTLAILYPVESEGWFSLLVSTGICGKKLSEYFQENFKNDLKSIVNFLVNKHATFDLYRKLAFASRTIYKIPLEGIEGKIRELLENLPIEIPYEHYIPIIKKLKNRDRVWAENTIKFCFDRLDDLNIRALFSNTEQYYTTARDLYKTDNEDKNKEEDLFFYFWGKCIAVGVLYLKPNDMEILYTKC